MTKWYSSQLSSSHPRVTQTMSLVKVSLLVTEVITEGMGDLGGQGVRTGDMMTTTLSPGDTGTITMTARAPDTGTVGIMTRRSTIMMRRTTTGLCHMTDPGGPGLCTGIVRENESLYHDTFKGPEVFPRGTSSTMMLTITPSTRDPHYPAQAPTSGAGDPSATSGTTGDTTTASTPTLAMTPTLRGEMTMGEF